MRKTSKFFRAITAILLVTMFALMPSMTALAATASGTTGIMNSLNGSPSAAWNVTIPSGNSGAVTGVTLNLSISNGSAPFDFIITAPDGRQVRQRAVSGNNTVTGFNNVVQSAAGRWTVAIVTTGVVSTATGRLTVNSR
ncbi:MAG: hypothetical protein FWG64_03135 [Firmicutes bacterium]|nr:hypothetical protein [Bacillota bacterium]